ncbi:MAG: sulfite oxidase [Hyphomonas sp.]|uniref:sulfite oxidase n=1 Tax=Hyphomonas sp. TaxID=87 RepID=UPI0035278F9D
MADEGTRKEDASNALIPSRRAMLMGTGAALFAGAGIPVPFLDKLPRGMRLLAEAQEGTGAMPEGKEGLTILGDRPINMETPPHLLDDDVTPAKHFFVRNNGLPPDVEGVTDETWKLTIDGEVERPLELSIADLKRDFEPVTLRLFVECAGNGRKFYRPAASGNQWTFGGVSCADWTGVRLKDVLERAGVKKSAVYTGHYGADTHLSGDPSKEAISRGVPIEKALDPHSMIAWSMNGEDIPYLNGYPLRLMMPGYPGSCSQKWLTRIWIRDQVHDGQKMQGQSYRLPAYPVAPGTTVPDEDMKIIEGLPIKSLITFPQTGTRKKLGGPITVRGHAWCGEADVAKVDVSLDFGETWTQAELAPAPNRFSWRRFTAAITPPQQGYYEIWARATDTNGKSQPATTPGWNPHGYNNNMQHRIAVFVI